MGLWNALASINNSCTIEIRNGNYIDVSNSGFLGLSQKTSSISLNNAIIAGSTSVGRGALIDTLLYDAANSNKPIIYIRNRVNNQFSSNFATEIEKGNAGNRGVVLDLNSMVGEINLFKGLSLDNIPEYIIEIMSYYISMDNAMEDFSLIWLDKIFEALKISVPKEKFKVLKLGDYTFDWLKKKYDDLISKNAVSMSEYQTLVSEWQRISGVYQMQMMKFCSFAKKIKANGLAKLLSGRLTLKQVFDNKMIVLINLSEGVKNKESKILLDLFLKRLLVEETNNAQGCVCMFEDVNVKECAQNFIRLLQASQAKGDNGNVFFTEPNISWWLDNSSSVTEHPANYCNSFFVFKQNVPAALKYWSALSGATKKLEVSHNQAPLSSVYRLDPYSWTSIIFGHRMVYSGNSTKEVDTYRVEEHEIDNLDDKSCISILKMSEYIYNRKVRWL